MFQRSASAADDAWVPGPNTRIDQSAQAAVELRPVLRQGALGHARPTPRLEPGDRAAG